VLGAQLAARVCPQQLARVEPVLGGGAREDGREIAVELGHVRAAVMPERGAVGDLGEAEDLLDPAVAVGGDDEDSAGQVGPRTVGQRQDQVVVKLALRPVRDEVVAAEASREVVEQCAEHEMAGELVDGLGHPTQTVGCARDASQSPAGVTRRTDGCSGMLVAPLACVLRARPYAEELPPMNVGPYAAEHVVFAARAWTMRAEQERESAGVFAALASALVDAGAPPQLAGVFTRVVADELAHWEMCATLAARLHAPAPRIVPIARPTPADAHARRALALRLLLVEGAIGETLSCALFNRGRNLAREPCTRAALGRILRDEVGHARASWEALATLRPAMSEREREQLQELATHALGAIEQTQMVPVLRRLERGEPFEPAWAELGVLPPDQRVDAFYGALENRVLPRLATLGIDAARAWELRYRA
jgi:hypothetical protein